MDVKRWEIYLEMLFEAVFAVVVCGLLIYGVPKLMGFFWPFVIGWIIALLAGPLCNFLEKKVKVSRKWGSMLIIAASIGIVAGVIALLVAVIRDQAVAWATELPEIYHQMMEQLQSISVKLASGHIGGPIGQAVSNMAASLNKTIASAVSSIGSFGVSYAGEAAKGLTNALIGIIVMMISAYLFICEKEEIVKSYKKLAPSFIKDKVAIFCDNTLGVLVSYCLVQVKLMIAIAVILWIGLMIIRIRYSFLIAILISLLDVLPFLGTGTALIPWAIYMVITGQLKKGIGMLLLYGICLVFKQVLQPKMIGDRMQMNALTTVFLMYTGLKLKGITGFILALIFGMFFSNLYKHGAFDSIINRFKRRLTILHDLDQENK